MTRTFVHQLTHPMTSVCVPGAMGHTDIRIMTIKTGNSRNNYCAPVDRNCLKIPPPICELSPGKCKLLL